jgi:uncharacterized protein YukE
MKYSQFFSKVLLEQDLPHDPSSRTYDDSPDAMNNFLDNDTDPDQFLTQGIQQTFDAVQSHFNKKMSEFASTLSPEAIKQMPLGELRQTISDVFKFTNKIQIYSKGKIEQISQDPYAIMAAFLASEPTKMAAFEELHGNLEDFQNATQELEGQLAMLKGQIDDFVSEVEGIDAEEAAGQIEGQMGVSDQAPMGRDNMSRGNPASLGMSYSESRNYSEKKIIKENNRGEISGLTGSAPHYKGTKFPELRLLNDEDAKSVLRQGGSVFQISGRYIQPVGDLKDAMQSLRYLAKQVGSELIPIRSIKEKDKGYVIWKRPLRDKTPEERNLRLSLLLWSAEKPPHNEQDEKLIRSIGLANPPLNFNDIPIENLEEYGIEFVTDDDKKDFIQFVMNKTSSSYSESRKRKRRPIRG